MDRRKRRKLLWSLFFVAIGSLIWLNNWGLIEYSFKFSRDWPVILLRQT
ncbi:MAG: hypothetical protein HY746_08340 [Elusimicrobia bacterium]|nr:hypothetical protein [Elusimicrobiota bacterium]